MTDIKNVNTLLLSDEELKALSDAVRQSKVTATTEEILLVKMGKSAAPLLDVTFKVVSAWEQRYQELSAAQQMPVAVPDAKA
jgi:hypothetical protein